jgi:DNA-binding transcriptional ArsR family regulator
VSKNAQLLDHLLDESAVVFSALSAPMRLRIISSLCHGEKNVTELLSEISTTQPNISQHLKSLYNAGVLSKRRLGTLIYYSISDDRIVQICQLMCERFKR